MNQEAKNAFLITLAFAGVLLIAASGLTINPTYSIEAKAYTQAAMGIVLILGASGGAVGLRMFDEEVSEQ